MGTQCILQQSIMLICSVRIADVWGKVLKPASTIECCGGLEIIPIRSCFINVTQICSRAVASTLNHGTLKSRVFLFILTGSREVHILSGEIDIDLNFWQAGSQYVASTDIGSALTKRIGDIETIILLQPIYIAPTIGQRIESVVCISHESLHKMIGALCWLAHHGDMYCLM